MIELAFGYNTRGEWVWAVACDGEVWFNTEKTGVYKETQQEQAIMKCKICKNE